MHGHGPPGYGPPGYGPAGHGPPGYPPPGYPPGYAPRPPGYGPPGPGGRPPRGGAGVAILIGVGALIVVALVGGVMFALGRSLSAPAPTVTAPSAATAPAIASPATAAPLLVPVEPDPVASALPPLATAPPPKAAATAPPPSAAGKIRGRRYNFVCPKGTEPNGAVRAGCLCDSQILNPCAAGFSNIEETAWGCWFTCE